MAAHVTVLYPKGVDFKLDYYKSTHMPLVSKHLTQYGLKSWSVLDLGEDAPYKIQATLYWDNMADFQKAASSEEMKEILADVPNFSNKDPVLMPGTIVATS